MELHVAQDFFGCLRIDLIEKDCCVTRALQAISQTFVAAMADGQQRLFGDAIATM